VNSSHDGFRGADDGGLLTDARMVLTILGSDRDAHRTAAVLRP
jgi:hypothetical protein